MQKKETDSSSSSTTCRAAEPWKHLQSKSSSLLLHHFFALSDYLIATRSLPCCHGEWLIDSDDEACTRWIFVFVFSCMVTWMKTDASVQVSTLFAPRSQCCSFSVTFPRTGELQKCIIKHLSPWLVWFCLFTTALRWKVIYGVHLYFVSNPNNCSLMEAASKWQHLGRNRLWLCCVTGWCAQVIRPGFNSN